MTKGFSASRAQRNKIRDTPCIVCGRPGTDPAHLSDRSLGGCDEPDCVVSVCREHHREYDEGRLDLLPYLEPGFRVEQAHMVGHLGLARAFSRATNRRLA